MSETLSQTGVIFPLLGIFLMTAIGVLILHSQQRRQARAVEAIQDVAEIWLARQIKAARADHNRVAESIDAFSWAQKLAGRVFPEVSLSRMDRVIAEAMAVEFLTSDNRRLVISTLDKRALGAKDGRQKGGDRLSSFAARPILGRKVETAKVTLADNEWLDIEAEAVGSKVGIYWTAPEKLWLYMVG